MPNIQITYSRRLRGFSLIELMIVVAIIGILAAIAIPSLQKSVRRSRTSEALMGLRKLFDGSVTYLDREHTNAAGDVVPPQFPGDAGPTPGDPPQGMKADPQPGDWDAATWQALDFAVTDPYYYTYVYLASGSRSTAQFTAISLGDLDGDQAYSTFFRGGRVEAGREVRGFPGVARVWELE